ncbi:MAG TPA: glycosyltransferase [Opitutaceae bacterium]|jgi:glycosyltransferase involved in cell wall biosynthesis|nr:glycosyltransferase [Opitutaceae bacterium]
MSMLISVAICTRNPRRAYLDRVLEALALQTLPRENWELLIVDSASDHRLSANLAGSTGLACRIIRLDLSGLLRARFAAIAAATAPVLLFLDDDNVPVRDFLERGLELSAQWPMLGCWGPARILPECETTPTAQIVQNLGRMACCDFPTDRWSSTLDVVPPGAGLFVRLECARSYAAFAEHDPRRQLVGETADRFFRGDDTDLVFFIVKSGLGAGQFRSLQLTHLMPNRRLTEDYVVMLAKVAAGSAMVINYLWGVPPWRESRLDRVIYHLKAFRFRGLNRKIARAHREGEAEARELIGSLKP